MTGKDKTPQAIIDKLEKYFSKYLNINSTNALQLLGKATLQDKAYELVSLIEMMNELKKRRPSMEFTLSAGTSVVFRGKGGPIDRKKWPFINIVYNSRTVGEIWVDIEFISLSACNSKNLTGQLYAKCHELDVLIVEPGTNGRPHPHSIKLAIEAKHRPYSKQLLKELLGVRREMAMRTKHVNNHFAWWTNTVPATPPSALISFCSCPNIKKYSYPESFWGIKMKHLPLGP